MTYKLDKLFMASLAGAVFFGWRQGQREGRKEIEQELLGSAESISLNQFMSSLDTLTWWKDEDREEIKHAAEMFFRLKGHKVDFDRNTPCGTFSKWLSARDRLPPVVEKKKRKKKKE